MVCRICHAKKISFYLKYPYFNIYSCHKCDTLFASLMPSDKEILKIYSPSYFVWKENEKMKRKTFSHIFNLLERYTSLKNKRLLDIGCATGYLLMEAKSRQMDCFGLEISLYAAKIASKRFPKKIFKGPLEKAPYLKNSFDIITMIDFIEHTKDPVKILTRIKRILKNDGLLVIVTPNTKSVWAKILGNWWTNFKKEHLYYFSEKSLSYLSKRIGFKIIYSAPAKKYLTLDYIYSYLKTYPMPILSIISKIFLIFPKFIRNYPFYILTDDLMLVLQHIP